MVGDIKKILLLDDYACGRAVLADELKDEGYQIVEIEDLPRILKVIRETEPGLVIMEICLGQQNGLDLLQEIRRKHYDLPVIIWTGHGSFRYDLRAKAADYYVVKSADSAELKSNIRKAFESTCLIPVRKTVSQRKRIEEKYMNSC